MKKILLIDVDSKIPNLALMKISGYYKAQGYDITLWRFGYTGYPTETKKRRIVNADKYDMVFVSCIFTCNSRIITVENCQEVYYGGTGYSIKKVLPHFISYSEPDYSIYPDNNISYGFITRGCIRQCKFCVVPRKEGRSVYKNRHIDEIVRHKKVRFLDNNILAYKKCNEVLQELIDKQIRCEFYQGLDIRLVDFDNAELLSLLNYMGEYTFAFDDIKMMRFVIVKISILKRYIKRDWKIRLFIYCNAEMNIKSDVIPRVEWCKANKVLPYIMRDANCFNSVDKDFYMQLTAWCNQPGFFKGVTFQEFILKRTISQHRKTAILNYLSN
jgi:hypothetical protein